MNGIVRMDDAKFKKHFCFFHWKDFWCGILSLKLLLKRWRCFLSCSCPLHTQESVLCVEKDSLKSLFQIVCLHYDKKDQYLDSSQWSFPFHQFIIRSHDGYQIRFNSIILQLFAFNKCPFKFRSWSNSLIMLPFLSSTRLVFLKPQLSPFAWRCYCFFTPLLNHC